MRNPDIPRGAEQTTIQISENCPSVEELKYRRVVFNVQAVQYLPDLDEIDTLNDGSDTFPKAR